MSWTVITFFKKRSVFNSYIFFINKSLNVNANVLVKANRTLALTFHFKAMNQFIILIFFKGKKKQELQDN